MPTYRLENDGNTGGDDWERAWWHYLKDTFPNYEIFWQKFIAEALTNRPENIYIQNGLAPALEEMAMAHYSVFHHLGTAHSLLQMSTETQQVVPDSNWKPPLHAAIFFHLSAATEMIDRLIFTVGKIACRIGLLPEIQPLSDDEAIEMETRNRVGGKGYRTDFERFLDTGQSVNVRLHSIRDFQDLTSKLAVDPSKWQEVCKEFNQLSDTKIRRYRNILTHNPLLGGIEVNGKLRIPNVKSLGKEKYRVWSSVFYARDDSDLILVSSAIEESLKELEEVANRLWVHLIDMMASLSIHPQYKALLGGSKSTTPEWTDKAGGEVRPGSSYTLPGLRASGTKQVYTGGSAIAPEGMFPVNPSDKGK